MSAKAKQLELMPVGWAVPWGLLVLAGPIIASMVSRTAMGFVDFVMVSQLGTQAQAAIMPAGVVLFCIAAFGMGLLSVVNTFVSQAMGRGEPAEGSAYAWQGVYLALLLGIVVLPGWWLARPLFAMAGHEAAVASMEVAYVQWGLWHIGPAMMAIALANFFNGIHRPVIGFWAAILSNAFNVVANYALIFGHLGFAPHGIAGAAQATALASLIQALILLGWFLSPHVHAVYLTRSGWRWSTRRVLDLLRIGLPSGLQWTTDIAAFTIFTLFLVGRFGTVQLAANNITFKFLEISFMPAVGLGVAVTAAVGKAIGQGQPELARITVRWANGFAVAYMGLIAVSYVFMGKQWASLLSADHNPQVIEWTVKMLWFCAVFQVFDAVGIIHSNALRGAGDTRWPAVMMVLTAGIVFMGGGFAVVWIAPQWGSLGPWGAATLYIMVLGMTFWLRWRFGPWRQIRLQRQPA